MKHLSVLIKPVSSRCNMRCRYCFYADVSSMRQVPDYGRMDIEVAKAVISNIYRDVQDRGAVSIGFQGGEPTLAGLDFFKEVVAQAKSCGRGTRTFWALQTNGMTLNDDWCAFLRENRFLVGLSLDGAAQRHNANRLDRQGKGSFGRVIEAKRLLDKHRVEYNILCVLTGESARHPKELWGFILGQNIRYVQFIPCLDALNGEADNPWALTPKRFYQFYSELFPLWQRQIMCGGGVSVKLFDDIANLFIGKQATVCGILGKCGVQNVVEADGGVYPCDFYVLDKYLLGNLAKMPLSAMRCEAKAEEFLNSRPLPPKECLACAYRAACGGGCKRMESAMYIAKDGFCGYRAFLERRLRELLDTVRRL